MNFLIMKTLNSILFVDIFEHTQPLNLEPNTIEEINLKSSSLDDQKGDIFKKSQTLFLKNTIIISAFLLLRMLSHCLSDDVFHTGLVKYLDKQLVKYYNFI